MHIVIGVITAVAGLIWAFVALQRGGVDLNALNPFLWHRRAQWRKRYGGKPIYPLSQPMDAAALLLLGVAKCEGEVSAEQKKELRSIFQHEFHLDGSEADDLLLASAYLIREEIYLVDKLPKILERSARSFTTEQIESLLSLMRRVGNLEGPPNEEQEKLIAATAKYFSATTKSPGKWQ